MNVAPGSHEFLAVWFDGTDPQAHPVRLIPDQDAILLRKSDGSELQLPRDSLAWLGNSDDPVPLLRQSRTGTLALSGPGAAAMLGIPASPRSPVARAWRSPLKAGLCAALLAAAIALAVGWAIPRSTDYVATRIPWRAEVLLGDEVLRVVDRSMVAPSGLPADLRQRVERRFDALVRAGDIDHTRLEFRRGNKVGPNAFALPGRIVVVTDELVALMGETGMLDAVLAHELAHVHHRHSTRALLRKAEFTVLVATLGRDTTMRQNAAAMAPELLFSATHSREAEREADAFAFALIQKTGGTPADFAEAMTRMQQEIARRGVSEKSSWLSSHPTSQERIDAAREAVPR